MAKIMIRSQIQYSDVMRSDGTRLGNAVRDALQGTSGDITLDFDSVTSASASAACQMYAIIARACGPNAADRLVFVHASPWVADAFETGYEHVIANRHVS